MYIYIYIYIFIHVYMYIYICIYTQGKLNSFPPLSNNV